MSAVYNPEAELIAEIERMELAARDMRRTIEHAHTPDDRRVLNRQLREVQDKMEFLRQRLP
jgi:hypothetical protein